MSKKGNCEYISFHLVIGCYYEKEEEPTSELGELIEEVAKNVMKYLSLFLELLSERGENIAFSVTLKGDTVYDFPDSDAIEHLKSLGKVASNDEFSILRRKKYHRIYGSPQREALSFVIYSKAWKNYCVANDKLDVECDKCKVDLDGWTLVNEEWEP